MKSIMKISLAFVLVLMGFSSCIKNELNTGGTSSDKSKLLAKWNLINSNETEYENGILIYSDTYTFDPGDYLNFVDSTKYQILVYGTFDSSNYSILSPSWILIDGDSMHVDNLTDNVLDLSIREEYIDNGINYKYSNTIHCTK